MKKYFIFYYKFLIAAALIVSFDLRVSWAEAPTNAPIHLISEGTPRSESSITTQQEQMIKIMENLLKTLTATNTENTNIDLLHFGDGKTLLRIILGETNVRLPMLEGRFSQSSNSEPDELTVHLRQGVLDLIASNRLTRPHRVQQFVKSLDAAANAKKGNSAENYIEEAATQLELLLKPEPLTPKAFLHVGYVTLNPYSFTNKGNNVWALNNDGQTSAFYVEFQYNNRWAWNWDDIPPKTIGEWDWVYPFADGPDTQVRFGYCFLNGHSESENIDVGSIVGGGNINAEVAIGTPFAKYQNDWLRSSFNLESSLGLTSDRDVFDVHATGFIGFGYLASVKSPVFPSRVLLTTKLGWATSEIPDIVNENSQRVRTRNQRPAFKNEWTTIALSTELMLPLSESVYVLAGGRIHANSNPNPWTAYIGISVALADLRDRLFGAGTTR